MTDREKMQEILKYCADKTQYRWAVCIAAIIFECDFRDAENELKRYFYEEYISNKE